MDLTGAYVRRMRWEARVQAREMMAALAEALEGTSQAGIRRIGADQLLGQFGIEIEG